MAVGLLALNRDHPATSSTGPCGFGVSNICVGRGKQEAAYILSNDLLPIEREGRKEAERSGLMLNKTDAAFLDDSMHVPLGIIRTHEATRQNPRVAVSCDVTLTISVHGSPVLGAFAIARNISGGGICFNSGVELPENSEVTVRCVPESGLEIEARGRIVACDATGDGDFRYRIEFVGVPAELTAAIGSYVYDSWKRKLDETVDGAIGERWGDSTAVEQPVAGTVKE